MRSLARVALGLALIGVMVFASGAVNALVFVDIHNPEYENPMARYAWLPVYGVTVALVSLKLPHVLRLVTFAPLLVVCVAVAGLSFLWSVDPALTVRRSVALVFSTSLGLALAAWLPWARLVQCVAATFLVLALTTLLVVAVDPARGVMNEIFVGAWRGPWLQKNELGGMMTKGLIACLGACAVRPRRAWLWMPAGVLCFALVLMSTSKTSLLISCGSLALFGWLAMYRKMALLRPVLWFVLIGGVSLFAVAVTLFPAELLGLIGKEPTLTGRTDIWTALQLAIAERPWGGYGYGAFWLDPLGASYSVRQMLEWGVPSAHNGWIEIWLAGGAGLVAAFALHTLATLGALLRRLRQGGQETYWAVLFVLAFIGFSMSESSILQQNDLTWILFVAASAKVLAGERMPRA